MPCYHPLQAYRKSNAKGTEIKFSLSIDEKRKYQKIELPCGQCIGCRIARSRSWAIRCMNEAETYGILNNCYLTLTYNDDNLPEKGNLRKKDFQNFMKEIRRQHHGEKYITYKNRTTRPIRFFHCGEYGETCRTCGMVRRQCYCRKYTTGLGRPHHHVCIFNFNFNDRVLESQKDGYNLYSSPSLEKLWKKGYHAVGDVTFESAAYVARYITKKITGKQAEEHYKKLDRKTGKVYNVHPEYITMSRRPGIGKEWYEKFKKNIFQRDCIIDQGRKIQIPTYYNRQFEETFPVQYEQVQKERQEHRRENREEYTKERLAAKKIVKQAQLKMLKRSKLS